MVRIAEPAARVRVACRGGIVTARASTVPYAATVASTLVEIVVAFGDFLGFADAEGAEPLRVALAVG